MGEGVVSAARSAPSRGMDAREERAPSGRIVSAAGKEGAGW